jgi:iron complex outermembrane receptor protein
VRSTQALDGAPPREKPLDRPRRLDSDGVEARPEGLRIVYLARCAALFACAGALTTSSPAAAQAASDDAAPAAPADPSAVASPAPADPSAAASPAPADASPAASPPAAGGSTQATEEYVEAEGVEEVVVSGFRSSLSAGLARKQRSIAQVDAIVAEDIADFPDLNLAESLQRIPGVAITRTNGEGNQITVRGLPGLYTRVRINGMEARSNIGNSGNNGGGRNFDFNLFASELFNSIVVHKTATADMEEGSLGAVVDLNTARAFNYKEGFTFVAGATAAYNDLGDTVRPRLTGLIAYRDPGGIWGATASAAYNPVRFDTVSTDTVNWQRAPFGFVDNVDCSTATGDPNDPGCAAVNDAFHPRIPRFGQEVVTGHRLGLTAGFELRPTHSTEIRLDGLYASYPTRTEQRRLFPLFRGNEGQTRITNPTIQPFPDRFGVGNDSLIAANADNAWIRSEHVRLDSLAKFYQITLGVDQRITDKFRVEAFGGTSRSSSGLPHDTTVNYDNRNYDGYRFDFTNDKAPILAFNGADVSNPATFVVPELRDRVGSVKGGFDTAELNLHYDPLEQLKLSTGVNYKRSTFENEQSNRDGTVCALGLYDCTGGDDDPTNDVLGPPGDPALTSTLNYAGEAGPGSTTRWASPVIDGWVKALNYYDAPLTLTQGGTSKVSENNLGYFLQGRGEFQLGAGDMRLQYDAGLRYVQTRQSSSGYRQGEWTTVDRPTYDDLLPSANLAFWATDTLVTRLAAAKVMARPALPDLSPGAGVDSFGYTVNFQNPNLDPVRATTLDAAIEWYFAEGSLVSIAGFYKNIESFPIRQSTRGTFASTGLPHSAIQPLSPADVSGPDAEGTCGDPAGCWDISQLTNGPGSKVKGVEMGFQAPFREIYGKLPPVLINMGIVANYTYVNSSADYVFLGNPVKERLIGLSNHQYNATLYYEDSIFSIRASLAYRSDYLVGGPNSQGNLWTFQESDTRLDASSGYNVTDHLKLSLEALNLTNTPFAQKVDVDANRRNLYNKSGRTFLLGARLSY